EAVARQHLLRAVAPEGRRRVRAAVRPRIGPGTPRQVRREVRERSDARLRRARPQGGRTIDDRSVREGHHPEARSGGVRGLDYEITPRRPAYSTISAVLCRSSFCRMWARCVSTVAGLIDRRSAVSLLLCP